MQNHLINSLVKLDKAVAFLEKEDAMSFDCETTGLFPFHGDKPFSYIFSTKEDNFYIDLNIGGIPKTMALPLIQKLFNSPERKIFGVNLMFDLCMAHADGIKPLGRFIDCPSLARVEYNQHEGSGKSIEGSFLSMDYLAKWYLSIPKDDTVKQYIKENNLFGTCIVTGEKKPLYKEVPLEIMKKYGWSDGRITYDLARSIIRKINQKDIDFDPYRPPGYGKLIDVAKNEIELTSVLYPIKLEGFKIDREYINRAIKLEKELRSVRIGEIDRELGLGFQYTAGAKVTKVLEDRGFPIEYKEPTAHMLKQALKARHTIDDLAREKAVIETHAEKTKRQLIRLGTIERHTAKAEISRVKNLRGNAKADAKNIEKYAEKFDLPWLNTITKAKQCDKKIGTYYEGFLKLSDKNDVVHCGLNQEVAVTGRFSSSDPNLQNLHKELWNKSPDQLLIRNSFIAFPECRLIFADYSQQEMYVMLDQAGEMDVINKLKSGEFSDFYLATAEVVFEKTGLRITRSQAKAIALGLAYGQGKALLAKNLGVSLDEAGAIIEAFFSALPKLKKFKDDLQSYAKRFGRIHLPSGRVYYVEKGYEYKALNAFVQGTSADITKKAMVMLGNQLKPYKTKMTLTVHDELIFNLNKFDPLEKVKDIIEECMVEAYPAKHIKLGVDFEISEINERGVSPWGQKVEYS